MRRTKIIATVGPASNDETSLGALIAAGTDVVRLNFSHGTADEHKAAFRRIREAAARAGRDVAILQDLGGPKIRIGRLEGGRPIILERGDRLRISTGDGVGNRRHLFTTFEGLAKSVKPGDRLLLADGLVELRVDGSNGIDIDVTVINGGEVGEHKGINAPGVPLPTSAITPKDAEDLRVGLELGVDLVAVSFVQTREDLETARQLTARGGQPDIPIIAKLERPKALEHLDDILEVCDGVMIARGDLGLEIPLEQVPRAQKDITRQALARGKPIILATQVLESMTREARPTRAEVSDAANAVDDGVDAIMLSGETAVGVAPAHVVRTLDAIVRDAESAGRATPGLVMRRGTDAAADHAMALCMAAATLAERGAADAIVAVTRRGKTARRLSRLRPAAPIVAATSRAVTARRLALHWGVTPVHVDPAIEADHGAIAARLIDCGAIARGWTIVLINIDPDRSRPDANYLRLQQI